MHSSSRTKESVLSYYELASNSYKKGWDLLEGGDYSTAIKKFEFSIRQIEKNNPELNQKHDNVITYQFEAPDIQFETNKNAALKRQIVAIVSNSAIGITEKEGDVRLLANCRYGLGYAYCKINRNKKAMKEFQLGIKLINSLDEKDDEDNLFIALCHSNNERIFSAQEKYTDAINEGELACAILERINDKTDDDRHRLAGCRNNLGFDYYCQDNLNVAIKQIELAIEEFDKFAEINAKDQCVLASFNSNIGKICSDQNNSKEAIARFELAIQILEQMENKEQSANEQLVDYYKEIGEEYYKQYEDSLSKRHQLEKQLQLPQTQLIDEKNEKPPVEMKNEKSPLLANSILNKSKTKSSETAVEKNEPSNLTFGQY